MMMMNIVRPLGVTNFSGGRNIPNLLSVNGQENRCSKSPSYNDRGMFTVI